VDAAFVRRHVLDTCPRLRRASAKVTVVAVRQLLAFLYVAEEIERSLADAVPAVAGARLSGLPKRIEAVQVQRILNACDRGTVAGRRNYAIALLLARLGVRAGEAASLTLDDIDWRAAEIVVRGKGRAHRLPLPDAVGEAIAAFLRDGRPMTGDTRAVFVTVLPPARALGRGAVCGLVVRAAEAAGVGHVNSHRLRHTLASEMLAGGADLPSIGQVLGHRMLEATAIYANVIGRRCGRSRGRGPERPRERARRAAVRVPDGPSRARVQARRHRAATAAVPRLSRAARRAADHDRHRDCVGDPAGRVRCAALRPARRGARLRQLPACVVDPTVEVPGVELLPLESSRRRPFLYTEQEILALMTATGTLRTPHRAATYRTLIGLLASTGIRIGQAIAMDHDDFDARLGVIVVRGKRDKIRELPLAPSTTAALQEYVERSDRPPSRPGERALFVSMSGARVAIDGAEQTFSLLRARAGLRPRAGHRPTLHGLRHTFVMRTMLDAQRDGVDAGARLGILSTYLGHVEPADTYWYLHAAPELMSAAAERLERHEQQR
jgi:integrase